MHQKVSILEFLEYQFWNFGTIKARGEEPELETGLHLSIFLNTGA
jgi:hypothetical protein